MLGRGLLFVAIGFAAFASLAAPASARRPELLVAARRAMVAAAIAIAGSAVLLWYALFARDFSLSYVWASTSRAAQPWYTFSALWSGMAGSLLLWCLILAVYAAVFVRTRSPLLRPFVPWAIPVLGACVVFFVAITAVFENPFARLDVVPADGRGMNPLLHSPGMVIHPPLLYAGLIGLLIPFAVAVSAMVTKRPDWIGAVRRWTLVPWLALGAGLVLGGSWAYTELGWGGYWGWDPVENAALLPWLAATAFVHSSMVEDRRGMLRVWNVFLATAAATLAVFGTFLTRSGLLSSVHAFAESPVGRWFFVFLGVQTVLGLSLLAWRWPMLRADDRFDSAVSKEGLFLVNNFVFLAAVFVVLWGTLLPLTSEAIWGREIAVGPPFFNRVFSPLAAILLVVAAIGSVTPWRRGSSRAIVLRLTGPAIAATVLAGVTLLVTRRADASGVVWVATLLGATSLIETVRAARARGAATGSSTRASVAALLARNPRRYGGYLVHLGVAVMVIGFAGSLFRTQTQVEVSPGGSFDFAGYTFVYRELQRFSPPDKDVNLAVVDVRRGGGAIATLRPQLNLHRNWDQPQSEIAIRSTPRADLYLILAGTRATSDDTVFRVHHNPLVMWVWIGAVIAVLGGLSAIALRPRRRREASTPATRQAAWTR